MSTANNPLPKNPANQVDYTNQNMNNPARTKSSQSSSLSDSTNIPAVLLMSQQSTGSNAPVYMSAVANNPPPTNAIPAGPDINVKAANVYQDLQSGLGRVAIGNDTNVLDKINNFLTTYPQRDAKRNKLGQLTPDTWIDMSVRELFQQTIQTLIDIINDLSTVIADRQFMSSVEYRRQMFDIFAREDRRLYVGLILIFLSFVLYFIDSAT